MGVREANNFAFFHDFLRFMEVKSEIINNTAQMAEW